MTRWGSGGNAGGLRPQTPARGMIPLDPRLPGDS